MQNVGEKNEDISVKSVCNPKETSRITGPRVESPLQNGKIGFRDYEIPKKRKVCESLRRFFGEWHTYGGWK